jgi:hypothetical protein
MPGWSMATLKTSQASQDTLLYAADEKARTQNPVYEAHLS